MQSKITGVYAIKNTQNGKVYVGSAQDIAYRWRKHKERLVTGRHINPHLQASWNEYGGDSFVISTLEVVDNIDNLLTREQYWIDTLYACDRSKGYNIALHAGAPMRGRKASEETRQKSALVWKGRKHTPETIEKMRQVHKGKQYCLGRKLSEKHRAILAESSRTRTTREETKEKLRSANLGKKASDETKQKMRDAHLGKKASEEAKQTMREACKSRSRNPDGTYKIGH